MKICTSANVTDEECFCGSQIALNGQYCSQGSANGITCWPCSNVKSGCE